MPGKSDELSMGDVLDEVGAIAVGLGIFTFALFPLSVPIILLTLVLAVPLVAVALVAAVLLGPIVLVRRLRR